MASGPGSMASQLIGVLLTELAAPLADGFVGHHNPARKEQFFDVPIAQAEAEVQPDAVADDLGREAVMLVAVGRWCVHVTSIAHWPRAK
jgi:hypothetical protein